MELEQIRSAFSMAQVAFSKNKLILTYKYVDECFIQSIGSDQMDVFVRIFKGADSVYISKDRGSRCMITFNYNDQLCDAENVFFPPLTQQHTWEEISESLKEEAIKRGITEEEMGYNAAFVLRSLREDTESDDLIDKLHHLFNKLDDANKTNRTINFDSVRNYPMFKEAAVKFMKYDHDMMLYSPADDTPGIAEIIVERFPVIIEGDLKMVLDEFFDVASEIFLVGNAQPNNLELTLYS